MFWEILLKLAELHSTEDVLLTPKDGILSTGHTCEDGQLQSDDKFKLDTYTSRGVVGVRGCQGDGRGCIGGWQEVYALRGQQGYQHQGALAAGTGVGVLGGHQGCIGAGRECSSSGASRE